MKRGHPELCRYQGPDWSVRIGDESFITTKFSEPPEAVPIKPVAKHQENRQNHNQQQQPIQPQTLSHPSTGFQYQSSYPGPTQYIVKDDTRNPIPNGENGMFDKLKVESLLGPSSPMARSNASNMSNILEDDGDERIDFYRDNYEEPSVFGEGTLTWVTMLKKDIYSRALILCFNKEKVIFTRIKSSQKEGDKFANRFMDEEDLHGELPEFNSSASKKQKSTLHLLKEALQDRHLIWLLVDKFFDSELYCILPILEKDDFILQISTIIGQRNSKTKQKLKIGGKVQLAILGTLVIVMRLASLSFFNAGKPISKPLTESDQYIIDHPVKKEVLTITKRCLEEVSVFKESHLAIFQLNLMTQHYKFFAPEDCDCITASTITNIGPLLHAAISSGLNRDPKLSRPKYNKPNLLRRLWHLVAYLDYYQLMLVGYAPIINHEFHDTELPSLDHNDPALQYSINEAFYDRKKLNDICNPLLMSILSVKRAPKIRDVLLQMKKLEEYVDNIPKVDELLRMPSDTVLQRYQKLKLHNGASDSTALLFMIYFNFFLHYNMKKDSEKSLYYLLQLLRLSKSVFPYVHFFKSYDKSNENHNLHHEFGVGILALPKIELCLHKVSEFMLALLGRIKVYKTILGRNIPEDRLALVDQIAKLVFKITFFLIDGFANISDTYYHAWSTTKIQSFIIEKILQNREGPYEMGSLSQVESEYVEAAANLKATDEGIFLYSNEELKQILSALEIIDISALGQSPSPERLLYDLNSYKSKNDQLWFDQLILENNFEANTGSTNYSNDNNDVVPDNINNSFADFQQFPEWDPFGTNSISDLEHMLHHTINDF